MSESISIDDIQMLSTNKNKKYETSKNPNYQFITPIIFIPLSIILPILFFFIIFFYKKLNKEWKIQGKHIKTKWAEDINYLNPWPQYPRPQLERNYWINLNGLWDYSIVENSSPIPKKFDGKILVPYPLESSLSGVMKNLSANQDLYYKKIIKISEEMKNNKKIILHFGAVDYYAQIFINFQKIGEHYGGYSPFYFDISNFLNNNNDENVIIVKVYDPTNRGYQAVGKQNLFPEGIWYTPVSGIWQTVWIEAVEKFYITNLIFYNDFDNKTIKFKIEINEKNIELKVKIKLLFNDKFIEEKIEKSNNIIFFILNDENFHPWNTENPNLYNIEITLLSLDNSIIYDKIKSYTLLRKVEKKKDKNGIYRIFLNNNPIFNIGVLDQGYFPDGLYTPSTEEALLYDLKTVKKLGFNTIRKHAKVESAIYYYYTDKLGILIWQDMVQSEISWNYWDKTKINGGEDTPRSEKSIKNFYNEWNDIINFCNFFQSIIIWVIFNEGWGQFKTENLVNFTKNIDSSRLINSASGGNFRNCGDIFDTHNYPDPLYYLNDPKQINVFGEYGGLSLKIKNHVWNDNNNFGQTILNTKDEVTFYYERYIERIIEYSKVGISAAIYTQTTDVETEVNGLITYDRKEIKVDEERVKKANEKVINCLK